MVVTLRTRYGKHIVTVNGNVTVYDSIGKALTFIFKERGLLK